MKNKILLLLSLAFSTAGFAQDKATFGVSAGLSSASVRGDAVDNLSSIIDYADGMVTTKNRTGFYAGAFADIPLGDGLSVKPGVYYTQKGYELQGALNFKGLDFLGINARAQLQTDYIDIPILLQYKIDNFKVFAGPQFSYLASANFNTRAGILGINLLNKNIDVSNQFNKWDMGVSAGVGFDVSKSIGLQASYDYGLQRIDANKNVNAYNQGLKLGVTVGF